MNYILGVYVSYAFQQFLHDIPNLIPNNLTGIIVQYDFFEGSVQRQAWPGSRDNQQNLLIWRLLETPYPLI